MFTCFKVLSSLSVLSARELQWAKPNQCWCCCCCRHEWLLLPPTAAAAAAHCVLLKHLLASLLLLLLRRLSRRHLQQRTQHMQGLSQGQLLCRRHLHRSGQRAPCGALYYLWAGPDNSGEQVVTEGSMW
jgi:hypothetical protein